MAQDDWSRLDPASRAWITYIEAELERGLPDGYRWSREVRDWRRSPPIHLGDVLWWITPQTTRGMEEGYHLYTSPDGQVLILTYGNTDAGARPRLWHSAFVLGLDDLRHIPLSEMIRAEIPSSPPNRYGLT